MILNKTILTDVDGVVLNWVDSFCAWMSSKGYNTHDEWFGDYGLAKWFGITDEEVLSRIAEFNTSAQVGFINPMPEAPKYIRKLTDHGFKFRAITSLGDCPYAAELRRWNLKRIFGDWTFDQVICLPLRASKEETLIHQKKLFGDGVKTIWIEDHSNNARAGDTIGFHSIVYAHMQQGS